MDASVSHAMDAVDPDSREQSIWPPQGPAPRILLRLWPLLLLRSAWTAPSVPLPSLPPALLLAPTLPWLFSLKQLSVLSMLASRLALPRLTPPLSCSWSWELQA